MRYSIPGRAAVRARQFVVSRRHPATLLTACAVLLTASSLSMGASEAERHRNRELSAERLENLRLSEPRSAGSANALSLSSTAKVHPSLRASSGMQSVVVRLKGESVGRMADRSASSRLSRKLQLQVNQDEFISRAQSRADMKVVARTQMVLNAVFVEVDASRLQELADDPMVERIAPVGNYRMHLSETVPYIGAGAVQNQGFDGTGVKVAVLDSGIDYTHADLGGGGTLADYEAATADSSFRDGLFPTARVVEGTDFVGEVWPDGPLQPDEDPIDFDGHGTHVADIIGGQSGVAPAVDLYAVKVCSSISTSCSGVALIQGMEFAVDPNGDGDPEDAVDIINMSLGADYGQPFDDDLSQAVEGATGLGVLTVASAGNGSNLPYIAGTPASAPSALSVAQTQVPSVFLDQITVAGADYPAVFQSWSTPPGGVITGDVQYADGAGGNLDGCAPFAAGSLNGLIVLVDRGNCNFTTKIFNIGNAGGLVGIIGLIDDSLPFVGGFVDPGGPIDIPGYMIKLVDADAIRADLPADGSVDPANRISLAGSMVATSSRGPQHAPDHLVKPEIGAPGASVSAEVGTGDGTTAFGGTSGASPMVAGAAALLLQAEPVLGPRDLKSRLVTSADQNVNATTDPRDGLAPITRIGGGEVQVDKALATRVAAWDRETGQPTLSFGFSDVPGSFDVLRKVLRVRNYTDRFMFVRVDADFRFADDIENDAVKVHTLPIAFLRPHRDTYLPVWLTVRGEDLRDNAMSSGVDGASPDTLTLNEYDGYLTLHGPGVSLQVPWHVLPRKASHVVARNVLNFDDTGLDQVNLLNKGVGTAQNDAYSLLAVSPDVPEGEAGQGMPTPDLRAVGIRTLPVQAGFCSAEPSFLWQFAVSTWERQQHLRAVSHQVALDVDGDGAEDFLVLNLDANFFSGLPIEDGRQLTWSFDVNTGAAQAFFFAEHSMNTGNTVLTICGEQIGLNAEDFLATPVGMSVFAEDFLFGGPGDQITGLTVTPLAERYFGVPDDVPGRSIGTMQVTDFGPWPGNSDDLGVMLITNGDRGAGAHGGATRTSELELLYSKEALKQLKGGSDASGNGNGKGKGQGSVGTQGPSHGSGVFPHGAGQGGGVFPDGPAHGSDGLPVQ